MPPDHEIVHQKGFFINISSYLFILYIAETNKLATANKLELKIGVFQHLFF